MNDAVKSELRYMFRILRQHPEPRQRLIFRGYIYALEDTGVISNRTMRRLRKAMEVCCERARRYSHAKV
jgi:hypothetical protein